MPIGENNAGRAWLLRLNAACDGFVLSGDLADGAFDPGEGFAPFGTGLRVITDIQLGSDGAVYFALLAKCNRSIPVRRSDPRRTRYAIRLR